MSLINQMLKDLDQRNATAEGVQPLSGDVRSVMAPRRMSLLLPLALAVALAAAGALTWFKFVKPSLKPEIVAPQALAASTPAAASFPAASQPMPVVAAAASIPLRLDNSMSTPVSPAPAKNVGSVSAEEEVVGKNKATAAEEPRAAEVPTREKLAPKPRDAQAAAMKVLSPQQRSDNYYRQAVAVMQQGRATEAKEDLRKSLSENPLNHVARQLLVGLLVEDSHQDEAITLLKDGLKLAPDQARYALVLARLQVETGDRQAGMATLESGLPQAGNDAEYHAFLAALLQREERHDAAVEHYLVALKGDPAMPNWLVGIGISLQALGKTADAAEAYARAQESGMLTSDLQQFVDQRLKQIKK